MPSKMYQQHFNFTAYPFSIAPNADMVYYNDQFCDAYAHLRYSIEHPGGIIILTGEVGTGKTTLARSFIQRLQKMDSCPVQPAYIFNPLQPVTGIMTNICKEFGVRTYRNDNYKTLTDKLYRFLVRIYKKRQRGLIIVDEAQHLDIQTLEWLRLLTNLETNVSKLVQIILVGQQELLVNLSKPEMRQFNQRIIGRFNLIGLSKDEHYRYIDHRLRMAHGNSTIIPPSLNKVLYKYTKGIPRIVNILCDRALIGAYAKGVMSVDKKTVKQAAAELFINPKIRPDPLLQRLNAIAAKSSDTRAGLPQRKNTASVL